MKPVHSIFFALIFFAWEAIAQPVLTATGINPVIGDTYTLTDAAWINPGNGGANQTWDFSGLVGTSQYTHTMLDANALTPFIDSCSGATVGEINQYSARSLYLTSPAVYQLCGGGGFNGGSGPVYSTYYKRLDLLRFPFTYNDMFIDTFASRTITSTGFVFSQSCGINTITADGYGTLILPNGTYTDVIRLHFSQTGCSGTGTPADSYTWYKDGVHYLLARVYNGGSQYGGPYIPVGLQDNALSQTELFPMPTGEKTTIKTPENAHIQQLEIMDVTGKKIAEQSYNGVNTIELNLSSYSNGFYFVQLTDQNGNRVRKMLIVDK